MKKLRLGVGPWALAAGLILAPTDAWGQAQHYPPGAVVQSLDEGAGDALTRHLRNLSDQPRNLSSLLGAATAALQLGDPQAALTFFARAEEVAPRDARVKAGMGSAILQMENPHAALKFFGDAVALGVPVVEIAKDRGLAYDLVGRTREAQADYALAMSRGRDPETERRLALSKAIDGDREAALAVLDHQLRQQDRAGWRARAFVLALTGDTAGAAKAVEAAIPAQASAMRPFLAMLPQLNAEQQALAVHFGHFPNNVPTANAANQYAAANVPVTDAGRPDARQPALGTRPAPQQSRATTPAQRVAPTQRQSRTNRPSGSRQQNAVPGRRPIDPAALGVPPAAAAQPQPVRPAAPQQAPRTVQAPVQQLPTVQARREPAPPASQPRIAEARPVPIATTSAITPTPFVYSQPRPQSPASATTSPPAAPGRPVTTADLPPSDASPGFADVAALVATLPANSEAPAAKLPAETKRPEPPKPAPKETAAATKPAPAKKAEAPKKAAPKEAEPAPPKEPSRIWVQIAGGADKAALPREFTRLKEKAPKLLGSRTPWITPLRFTNRLLVGPFKTPEEAQDFVNDLAEADVSAFSWTSPAGQSVEKLSLK